MFDDLKIRNKLVLLVAGPIVIVALLAAIGARSRQTTANDAARVERLVAVAQANSNAVDALQQESLYSSAMVGSDRQAWTAEVKEARTATDQALAATLDQLRANLGTSSSFRSTSTLAIDAADKLQYIREAVDQGYRWDQVAPTFASLQGTFLSVNETVSESVTDPQVAGELRSSSALASYKSAIARQASMLVGAAERGGFDDAGAFEQFETTVLDETNDAAIFSSLAQSSRKGDVRDALATDARIELETVRDAVTSAGADAPFQVDPKVLTVAGGKVLGDLHTVETDLFGQMIDASRQTRSQAERAANLFLVAAGLAIVAAIVGAVVLGRRITRPLNHLAEAADHLATKQMPLLVESLRNPSEEELQYQLGSFRAIEVGSKDEIGRLASSFNDVQRVATEVAAEQAALLRKGIGEMFVNLARRNQALLDRQIEFIDELERGEEDPDQLENLYRLDHLATRMRRNAESLLVLAGAEPPRRRGRPAPLANVVRAALAEVEDFGRIELLSFDEVLVASNAAADLAHLLSELMENATNFSPPETRVEVVGHRTKADGYVISVTDHGIGMSGDQILEANESLAKPPLVGLALSRSLGFIVVGRLSARHGIAVRMMPSPSGGVTAVVSIPPSLVTDGPGLAGRDREVEAAPVPSRLKPVLESVSGSGLEPLTFAPIGDEAPAAAPPVADPAPLDAPAASVTALPDRGAGSGTPGALPTRTFRASPGAARPGPLGTSRPAVHDEPAPAAASASAPLSFEAPSSPASLFEPAPIPTAPTSLFEPAPVAEAPRFEPADAPDAGLPEAIAFAEPGGADDLAASARLDGAPPLAPLPTRSAMPRSPAPEVGDVAPRPFFLEDSGPPRLFGRTDADADADPAPATPTADPVGRPAEPAAAGTRLFGGAPTTDGPPPAPTPAAAAPLVRRTPAVPRIPSDTRPNGDADHAPAASAGAVATEAAPAGGDAGPARTTTGLAKRVPRQAGGAPRAIPGADVERGVSASRRSPDEVRNLLSRYRDGQQRARTEEPVPAGSTPERDFHE